MKVRCQGKSNGDDQILVDTTLRTIEFVNASSKKEIIERLPLQGFYEFLNKILFVLYKGRSGQLMLIVDNAWIPFDQILELNYQNDNEEAFLSIKTAVLDISYSYRTSEMKPVSNLWYSEEDEDVDFGLWLSLVHNSSERKKIILESWGRN